MHRPHNELFATLHQLASTFTTVFEVLADPGPQDRQAAPRPTPPPTPDRPPPPPTKAPPVANACIACGGTNDEVSARMKSGRLCQACINASLDDLRRQQERARLEVLAQGICDQLDQIDQLIEDAVEHGDAHRLPMLGAEVSRLLDLFRPRSSSADNHPAEGNQPRTDRS